MKIIRSNKKGFGIHSPFVYGLVTRVLFVEAEFYAFEEIEKNQISSEEKLQWKQLFRLLHFFLPEKVLCWGEISDNQIQWVKKAVADAEFLHSENMKMDEMKALITACPFIIFDEESFYTVAGYPENDVVWFIKKKNTDRKAGHFFQSLPEQENGRITIELENAGIIIFDKKFPAQDYVIK